MLGPGSLQGAGRGELKTPGPVSYEIIRTLLKLLEEGVQEITGFRRSGSLAAFSLRMWVFVKTVATSLIAGSDLAWKDAIGGVDVPTGFLY